MSSSPAVQINISRTQLIALIVILLTTTTAATVNIRDTTKMFDRLDMDGNPITNLQDPTSAQHAATKSYVDNNAGGGGGGVSFSNVDIVSSEGGVLGAYDYCALSEVDTSDAYTEAKVYKEDGVWKMSQSGAVSANAACFGESGETTVTETIKSGATSNPSWRFSTDFSQTYDQVTKMKLVDISSQASGSCSDPSFGGSGGLLNVRGTEADRTKVEDNFNNGELYWESNILDSSNSDLTIYSQAGRNTNNGNDYSAPIWESLPLGGGTGEANPPITRENQYGSDIALEFDSPQDNVDGFEVWAQYREDGYELPEGDRPLVTQESGCGVGMEITYIN